MIRCDYSSVLCSNILLIELQICEANSMPDLNVGDWVIFNDKGAYTLTYGFSFNGFPQPYVYPFIGRKNWNSIFRQEHN